MFQFIFKKIFGSKHDRFLKSLRPLVAAVNKLEPEVQALSDAEFPIKIAELRERHATGESLDALLPETFALVREASVRALGMRHFDVQLIGGIVLHKVNIGRAHLTRFGQHVALELVEQETVVGVGQPQ